MTWLAWLVLTLLLGFFVAAECAAVSVRASRIRQQAEEGSRLARRLLPILSDAHRLDNYIAASQIGITLRSLVGGAYAQAALTRRGRSDRGARALRDGESFHSHPGLRRHHRQHHRRGARARCRRSVER